MQIRNTKRLNRLINKRNIVHLINFDNIPTIDNISYNPIRFKLISSKNGNNNLMMDVWYNGDRNSHRINVTEKSREPLSKAIEYLRTGHEYKLPIGFNG